MITLNGSRIYLREMEYADWIDVHKYASREIVCRYQPWGPNQEEHSQAFVKMILEDAEEDPRTRYVFAIFERSTEALVYSMLEQEWEALA